MKPFISTIDRSIHSVSARVPTFEEVRERRRRKTTNLVGKIIVFAILLFYAVCLLLPFYLHIFPVETIIPSASDWASLLVLASLCTVCLYILQIQVLKKVSAFTFNLTYNLEPIYSIVLAMLIFGEAKDLNFSFYTGLGLIFLSVALQTSRIITQMRKH